MAKPVICVDLSHYQRGFNFQDFKDSGGLGVILKASEGSFRDPDYSTFWDQAMDAKLAVASYHFLRPGDSTAQARSFLNVVKPRQGERVVADHEIAGVTLDDLVTFLQAIQSLRPDLQLTVYSGHLIKQQLGATRNEWLAENTSLWIAQYTTQPKPSWPTATWPTWSLWQHTDSGTVRGYSSPLDCDRFHGSDQNFLKWMGPVESA
jgi:lysozyme